MNRKKITLEYMMDYISQNHPGDKEWFKSVALKDGKYRNHLEVVSAFCKKYPEFQTHKKSNADILANW